MKYEFKSLKKAGPRLRKIFDSEVASAIHALEAVTPDKAIAGTHAARKHFKRVRALLRLGREALGSALYKQENCCFRDLGRRLAELRDAQVRVKTLDDLRTRVRKRESVALLKEARKLLMAEEDQTLQSLMEGETLAGVIADLKAARARAVDWPLRELGRDQVLHALRRSYRHARQAARAARSRPEAHSLHELRKRVKHLGYHVRLLNLFSPGFMEQLDLELDAMADMLGLDHDLWGLSNTLKSHARALSRPKVLADLRKLIAEERREQAGEALAAASRVLRLTPDRFLKQVAESRRIYRQTSERGIEVPAVLVQAQPLHVHE